MEEARSLNTFVAQLPTRGILRSSHSGHSRKFDKNSLHNSSLMASMRLLCNEQGGASLRVPPLCGKEVFGSTRQQLVRTCFGKGERVEKVDAALGVVGGDDARSFSGLGPQGWTHTRQ